MALMSQHWLISKACLMPAKDAVRNGYEITINDGTEIDPDVLDKIRKLDVKYDVNHNLIELVQMGRIFGIRIAMFKIETDNPADYYYKPFNPDGIKPGTYKGISQIDPYWITPQLSNEAAGNPSAIDFYEPTWWRINGVLIHRTHLIIFRNEEVPDVLKPTYIYGGVSIPQKIYERVYAAERTANEAPMLALTKRTDVITADMTQALANPGQFQAMMQLWAANRDNYGVKTLGIEESMQQFDTALADLDSVIMSQYQLVAAASNIPATKLLGTTPKGFNATGEYDESSYHEELKSVQIHSLTQFLERHHTLLIQSEIVPEFGIKPFELTVTWNPTDAMTNKEQAELNKLEAETGQILANVGAIDGTDERARIIANPDSGYNGLIDEDIELPPNEEIQSNTEET
jgi:phage-related protein (TIGR01555 family)